MLRPVTSQSIAQLVGIDWHVFDSSVPVQLNDRGNSFPSGYRHGVDQFLFGIDDIRAGPLQFTEAIQDEWPHESYCSAGYSGARHAPVSSISPDGNEGRKA